MVTNSTLITGANGFIGRRLVDKLLEMNQSISALVRKPDNLPLKTDGRLKVFVGDISDSEKIAQAVSGCSKVYHLASLVDLWNRDLQQFKRINVDGTESLLTACQSAGVKRVVIGSSCGIFGPSIDGEMIDETTTVNPGLLGPYEHSKYLQRELALKFNSPAMQIILVYPTRVFGPGPRKRANALTYLLRNAAKRKRCIVPGNGHGIGNYVFVDDVVHGMVLAMDKGSWGEGYILGGANLDYFELLRHLENIIQSPISIWRIPNLLLKVAVGLEQIRSFLLRMPPVITTQAVNKYTADWPVSTIKARRDLGYVPRDIESALKLTITKDWGE